MSVIIDPGHGGTDPGAIGNGIIEKVVTLETSLYQYNRLKALGVPVKLTRNSDVSLDSVKRTNIVKASGMKHCISNHINAGGGDGAEVIVSRYSNKKLATLISEELQNEGQNVRRIFTRTLTSGADYYYMHRMTGSVETVIVEYGFLDSKVDDVIQIKTKQIIYAEAVVKAYCLYAGYKYTAPNAKNDSVGKVAENILPDDVIRPSDDFNPAVRVIQTYLNYFLPASQKIEVDGYYGPGTEDAVVKFQKDRGIAADGIYGPNTKRELVEFYAEKLAKEKAEAEKKAVKYIVQAGAFSDRDHAERLVKLLKGKGFAAFVKTEK
jgi:N-acetylmuramoyl-L-alanine amidase/Putative peptidoglycan binding domain/SPOR domain